MTAIAQCGNGELDDDCTLPLPGPPAALVEVPVGWAPVPEAPDVGEPSPPPCESDAEAAEAEAADADDRDAAAADDDEAAAADVEDMDAMMESAKVVSARDERMRMCPESSDFYTHGDQ